QAGHHLAPLELSSGKNIYEELSNDFTLLALDGEDAVTSAFEDAAQAQNIPFSVINESFEGGREAYESRYILIRPDHYIVWCGDEAPADTAALMAKAVGG
ncbi:MAG: monooxygenase, partial [Rhodospirillaceae bacterium]|nr:monooxygenase [Rhodospirillaceae bacterium]